jgi:predicted nuclease with TOPRIM domain
MEKVTNEELARMIKVGFDNTATSVELSEVKVDVSDIKVELSELKFEVSELKEQGERLDARVGRIEADISEMRGKLVYHDEFEDLMARVKYLESKSGIESGK